MTPQETAYVVRFVSQRTNQIASVLSDAIRHGEPHVLVVLEETDGSVSLLPIPLRDAMVVASTQSVREQFAVPLPLRTCYVLMSLAGGTVATLAVVTVPEDTHVESIHG